jgi:hypothetical protein
MLSAVDDRVPHFPPVPPWLSAHFVWSSVTPTPQGLAQAPLEWGQGYRTCLNRPGGGQRIYFK